MWLECDERARGAAGPEVHSGQTKWTLHLGCGEMLDHERQGEALRGGDDVKDSCVLKDPLVAVRSKSRELQQSSQVSRDRGSEGRRG